jgi:hypothetical protein
MPRWISCGHVEAPPPHTKTHTQTHKTHTNNTNSQPTEGQISSDGTSRLPFFPVQLN